MLSRITKTKDQNVETLILKENSFPIKINSRKLNLFSE